jgi:hypothetical protein
MNEFRSRNCRFNDYSVWSPASDLYSKWICRELKERSKGKYCILVWKIKKIKIQ